MKKLEHTPGPIAWSGGLFGMQNDKGQTVLEACNGTVYSEYSADGAYIDCREADARLLAAAYNAFDSASKALNCNAVEFAEAMQDGGIAALVDAVKAAKEMSDWFLEHSRQADHAHSELKQPLQETNGWKELVDAGYNRLMASYHRQFEEALAKVKAGTP